jgi:protein-L-isoaspartate(D-aspartate) O-methyltransferase
MMRLRGVLRSPRIIRAFETTDRAWFVPEAMLPFVDEDRPLPIAEGQTNSQPSTVAFMLELLDAQEGDRVLDIGSGSGWTTALLCRIVGEKGSVLGLERIDALVRFGQNNLRRCGCPPRCRIEKAEEVLGRPGESFDRILVSAAAERFPEHLVEQLEEGGVLVIPVGNAIWRVRRLHGGTLHTERYEGFRFVPLIASDA